MTDYDVCPECGSCYTKYINSTQDDDYTYIEMKCMCCDCEYRCQLVEIVRSTEIKDEDGNYERVD